MSRKFSLKGLFGAAEAVVEVESSTTLVRMRNKLMGPPRNLAEAEATRIVEDVAIAGLTRVGKAFEMLKSQHVDTVIKLRNEIDGLFHEVFTADGAGTDDAVRKALDSRLPNIKKLYAELDKAIDDATEPLGKMKFSSEEDAALRKAVDETPAAKKLHEDRPVEADQVREKGKARDRLRRKGFKKFRDGFKVRFKDGAETVLKVENGRYVAELWNPPGVDKGVMRRIEEFSVALDPYSTDFRTTSVLQRNHVVQDSLMRKLFEPFGYQSDRVPTIWMRDSRTGSPHHQVTAQQRSFKTGSGSLIDDAASRSKLIKGGKKPVAPNKLSLSQLQRMGVEQMKSVGCPPDVIANYLKQFDRIFKEDVYSQLKNLPPDDLKALLGDWTPEHGIGQP